MATCSSILVWKIRWTEELAGYSPWGQKQLDVTERAHTHTHTHTHYDTGQFFLFLSNSIDEKIVYFELTSTSIMSTHWC